MSRFFSLFSLFFILLFSSAFAQESDVYIIENIPVNISAKTPAIARNSAVSTANREAFSILLSRLKLDEAIANQVSDEELSDMVRSQHIDDERIAGNNYSANFNITFARDFVEHTLAQRNVKNKGEALKKSEDEVYLVMPVSFLDNKTYLWEENNSWRNQLTKALATKSQSKLILPDADMENLAVLNRDNVSTAGYQTLEPMLSRYKASGIFLVFLSFDSLAKKATVDVSYVGKMQQKQTKLSFVNINSLANEILISKIAQKTSDYLAAFKVEDIKTRATPLSFEIRIVSLGNWLTIKNKIENSGLVNQLNIESISRDQVFVTVNYVNPAVDPIIAFAKIGISLNKESENFYIIKAN